ncbi:MAG: hypothetical protein KGY81_05160, partial [Phycisphaerae bacterium]|nr:hypothetical protein [Phycisphaerae bacterium]
ENVSKPSLYAVLLGKYPALSRLGGIKTVTVRQATDYGRPIWLEIIGTTGQRTSMRAEKLRYLLIGSKVSMTGTLYSMNCKIRDLGDSIEFYDGHGFGHGVGLSQWGAEDKAKRGLSAEEILAFYYPAAEIMRAY